MKIQTPLQLARKTVGKTQKQVAKESGITEKGYQQQEYGNVIPIATTAIRIARALGSTVEKLRGEKASLA